MKTAKIRHYVEHPLGEGQSVPLTQPQAHYLFGVMRLGRGDAVTLFNGRDGEWRAEVVEAGKRGGMLDCTEQSGVQKDPPDLWLLFAPIKKARTDFIVEKAAEMGAAKILPVQTEFTNSERIRQDRLQAHAVEAAEQCGILSIPDCREALRLDALLDGWDAGRILIFADEAAAETNPLEALKACRAKPLGLLIGPEGGFSQGERERIAAMENAVTISLGPRILRADTAGVAALAVIQAACGDW